MNEPRVNSPNTIKITFCLVFLNTGFIVVIENKIRIHYKKKKKIYQYNLFLMF